MYGIYCGYKESVKHTFTDWFGQYLKVTGTMDGRDTRHDLPFDSVIHVIVIPNYKEDYFTLCETLDVLASHARSLTQYRVILCLFRFAWQWRKLK
jgi:hypothetical protein